MYLRLLLVLCVTLSASAATFDELFLDKTMRVDYFHTSTPAGDEIVALDRVVSDGPWPGSRSYLVDTSNLGKYYFEVLDRDTETPHTSSFHPPPPPRRAAVGPRQSVVKLHGPSAARARDKRWNRAATIMRKHYPPQRSALLGRGRRVDRYTLRAMKANRSAVRNLNSMRIVCPASARMSALCHFTSCRTL